MGKLSFKGGSMAPCSSPAANGNSDSVVVNLVSNYSDDDLLVLRNYVYFVLLLSLFKVLYFY